ncbi:GNAT family N-acetyltransferase [Cellulosimicrobium marinum]|uniref:GNAT family N-acetyltransferase n=1 Tax=Cellulosimicrobium marinum TaxID=1638992 RepID=UPI001E2AAB33|nr:GNAT family protein [Cellulosimicrobium marinum]MCB7135157.1 GNAT family N-acetyltransferase [Cellulosimicrobium marinum]
MLHDVVLTGYGFRLEPLAPEHAGPLAGIVDEAMWSGMSTPLPRGLDGMADLVAATRSAADLTGFVVRRAEPDGSPGDVLGSTAFRDLSLVDRRVEIGRTFYARPAWGTLVNPVTKWLLMRHAFETWDVHRVGFRVDARNERSLAAMRRLGAYEEGVMRGHRAAPDGSRADSVVFSVLAPEWPGIEVGLLDRITRPRVVPALATLAPAPALPLAAS